uniref:Uncharacterized protein n=1 Tax=Anguilla anguilla TaxID=7936 RepID=A0A0E9SD14_ANGAN
MFIAFLRLRLFYCSFLEDCELFCVSQNLKTNLFMNQCEFISIMQN